jgi:hypothetical protein
MLLGGQGLGGVVAIVAGGRSSGHGAARDGVWRSQGGAASAEEGGESG